MLIEYDLFNKVMYMHSAGKEDNEPTLDEASIPETKKNEEE
jgi:hypothetical protein